MLEFFKIFVGLYPSISYCTYGFRERRIF
jgi:hypothetical protein